MKALYALPASLVLCNAATVENGVLGKVIDMLGDLKSKVVKEGEAEAKAYKEFVDWCGDAAANKGFEIKTAKSEKEELTATIGKSSATISEASTKIEELAASIAKSEAELAEATGIREKEHAEFAKAEAELEETVSALDRAIAIIGREQAKTGAFTQIDMTNTNNIVKGLTAVLDAVSISHSDQQKLTSLVQSQQSDDDDDSGAPAAAGYENKSGGIMDVLEDLKEKADGELADLRKAEQNALHNFDMSKQALEDQMGADNKDKDDETSRKSDAEETKATAEGDLTNCVKDLEDAEKALEVANTNCIQVAADHEATVASRQEELKAIDTATKILQDVAAGGAASFLQVYTQLRTTADLANAEVVNEVKNLAKKQNSKALAQLASRMEAVIRYGSSAGEDPFAKVKSLITDMIAKLEEDAKADATEKAYCDEEMAKTQAKKADLEGDVESLTSKLDRASSRSAKLKADVKELQAELASLAKSQAEMDSIRAEERSVYASTKSDLENGLAGVTKALGVLRDYYEGGASMLQDGDFSMQPAMPQKHNKASGAGGGIIDMLETVESDMSKDLAKTESEEADAVAVYEKTSQENKVTKQIKDQDVKYKTQEYKGLDKEISELSGDKATTTNELNAVLDYYDKLKDRCIAKPESYQDRAARREAEIAGLKDALNVLEEQAAFVQRKKGGKQSFLGM